MNFTTKTRYAVRVMLELAMDKDQKGVHQKDIAKNQGISIKYLDHIVPALKIAGLIINLKGKKSGYVLMKEPAQISMFEIFRSVEDLGIVDCLEHKEKCNRIDGCAVRQFWTDVNLHMITYLKSVNLQTLLSKHENMIAQEALNINCKL